MRYYNHLVLALRAVLVDQSISSSILHLGVDRLGDDGQADGEARLGVCFTVYW